MTGPRLEVQGVTAGPRLTGRRGDRANSLGSGSELDTSKMAELSTSPFRFSTGPAGRLAGASLPDLMEEGLKRGGGLEEQGVEVEGLELAAPSLLEVAETVEPGLLELPRMVETLGPAGPRRREKRPGAGRAEEGEEREERMEQG